MQDNDKERQMQYLIDRSAACSVNENDQSFSKTNHHSLIGCFYNLLVSICLFMHGVYGAFEYIITV
jgi:hypothetical protein